MKTTNLGTLNIITAIQKWLLKKIINDIHYSNRRKENHLTSKDIGKAFMIKMLSNLERKGTILNVLNYLPIFYSKNVFTVESFLIQSVTSKDINYHHIYFLFYWWHQQIIVYKLNRQKKKRYMVSRGKKTSPNCRYLV